MIISGDFIAINSKEDFVPFVDDEGKTPECFWFNIKNIVGLSCYEDYYRLIIDDEHMVELRQPAANELIALMRKDRDDKVKKFFEDPKNREAVKKEYFDKIKEASSVCTTD